MRIFDRANIGGSDGFMLDTWPGGQLRLITSSGYLQDTEPVPPGAWTHVAVTYSLEEGAARLYRNGRLAAEGVAAGKLNPSKWPLNLGASQGGGDRFVGLMDEARIYARALAPEEIQAHYEGREIEPPALAKATLAPLPAFLKGGKLQVDYAAQCARNDLVYLSPARYPFEAMRLGNGVLGVTLWNQGGMTWQLNHGNWRRGNEPLSSGKLTLTTPALGQEQPTKFDQRLRLWDGTVTTAIDHGPTTSCLDYATRKTFITSSPRWLITFTAMRPVLGLGKGRDVSECRLAQASALISALRVVLRAL